MTVPEMVYPDEHSETNLSSEYDIMKRHSLGAEIWKDIDAQEYVNQLREEWKEQN